MSTTTQKKTTPKEFGVKAKASTAIEELPNNPFIYEILSLASKQRTNAKKIEILKKYDHPSLKSIFIWNFDDSG